MSRPCQLPFTTFTSAFSIHRLPRAAGLVVATVTLLLSAPRSGLASQPITGQFQANSYTTNAQLYPAIALAPNGHLLVTWESNGSPGDDTNGYSIQGRLYRVFTPASEAVAIPAVEPWASRTWWGICSYFRASARCA